MAETRPHWTEDTMTTTPNDPTTALLGHPPAVGLATWQTTRDEPLVREKAHTREGDAIAVETLGRHGHYH
jgi:Bacterial protein of unknown function (DUF899)